MIGGVEIGEIKWIVDEFFFKEFLIMMVVFNCYEIEVKYYD